MMLDTTGIADLLRAAEYFACRPRAKPGSNRRAVLDRRNAKVAAQRRAARAKRRAELDARDD